MDKRYLPADHEQTIYQLWEKSGAFKPEINPKGKPYTILMPPPNANASLHSGHAMYSVDDIIIRFKRMQGYSALWQPGMDHAGFETQFVYEKHLRKQGKSRLDFDRQTLYQNIHDFVKENSGLIFQQFKRLGFSADWSRNVFTLDPHVIKQAFKTFQKMEKAGYVYRNDYIVNYCTKCGTSFSELEIEHEEIEGTLYHIKYPLKTGDGFITVATTRPETYFGDTAVMVNPTDKRYKKYLGQTVILPLINREIPIIADKHVDKKFGTGAVKVTPAHDFDDFEVGKRHNLETKQVINFDGRMINTEISDIDGLKVPAAREKTLELLKDYLVKTTAHSMVVKKCYKTKNVLEPLIVPNWFIKVKDLKQPVINAVKDNKVKFFPTRNKKRILQWLDKMHDWPISRQIVWGIRIPVWYSTVQNPNIIVAFIDKNGESRSGSIQDLLSNGHTIKEIEQGLQTLNAPIKSKYKVSQTKPGPEYLPETDTFDTWFSSGQWPIVTLKDSEFKTRLPTDLIGTYVDILEFWISRMIMFSLYLKNEIPYKNVYLWSVVADKHGLKMSKSKGNVINPMEFVDKYGADALRFSLMYGIPAGSKVILSEDKVRGMRNFANKLWNIGRFLEMNFNQQTQNHHSETKQSEEIESQKNNLLDVPFYTPELSGLQSEDKAIIKKLNTTITKTTKYLDKFQLNEASQLIYDFAWHEFADIYIEQIKDRLHSEETNDSKIAALSTLRHVYLNILKLLHPFMPFVTETIWQELKHLRKHDGLLITSTWPIPKK